MTSNGLALVAPLTVVGAIAATFMVLPIATIYWMWTRQIFSPIVLGIWTAIIGLSGPFGAVALIIVFNAIRLWNRFRASEPTYDLVPLP